MSVILVVHHDADLYGADQSLLGAVRALVRRGHEPIVVLPRDGPLIVRLRESGAGVHVGPVLKVTRQLLKPAALPKLLAELLASLRFMSRVTAGRHVALVYSNSIAALGGGVWAALHRVPRLWHVREIVTNPPAVARGFPLMLRLLGGWCVCNSAATRRWIVEQQPMLSGRSSVIWNGLEIEECGARALAAQGQAVRSRLGISDTAVLVTLVGRLNRWKGQSVLISAAAEMAAKGDVSTRFLLVGDVADGQVHFRDAVLKQIADLGLESRVIWHPFTPEIASIWAASDVAVVPSTEPEPFGRVAIEAMAKGLPVVASGHGGLVEIVDPGVTGTLVPPGDVPALASALAQLVADPIARARMGTAGRQRQAALFTQARHDEALMTLVDGLLR